MKKLLMQYFGGTNKEYYGISAEAIIIIIIRMTIRVYLAAQIKGSFLPVVWHI